MVGMEEITQLAPTSKTIFEESKNPAPASRPCGISCVAAGIHMIEKVLNARRKSEQFPDIQPTLLALANATEDARIKTRPKPILKDVKAAAAAPATERKWKFQFNPSAELAAKGITVNRIRESLGSLGEVTSAAPLVLKDGSVAFEFTLTTNKAESAFAELKSQGIVYTELTEMPEPGGAPKDRTAAAAASSAVNIVRVDMNRLDELMRIVGEIVITVPISTRHSSRRKNA